MIPAAAFHTRQCLLLLKMEGTSGAGEKKVKETVMGVRQQPKSATTAA
jgi:hypothetical protein